jgi:hypothetical protein
MSLTPIALMDVEFSEIPVRVLIFFADVMASRKSLFRVLPVVLYFNAVQ